MITFASVVVIALLSVPTGFLPFRITRPKFATEVVAWNAEPAAATALWQRSLLTQTKAVAVRAFSFRAGCNGL